MRPPSPEYLKFLSAYDPVITTLALATRSLVLEEVPQAAELVYDAYNAVAAGYSFTGRPSDAFIHIAAYSKWVNLGFHFGSRLSDPKKLLCGSGQWVRHIRIAKTSDLDNPAIRDLVRQAIAKAERGSAPAESIVRAVYPWKRRPACKN